MHRVHRWLPIGMVLALAGFAIVVAAEAETAQADGTRGLEAEQAEPYREGPLERRGREPLESFAWPRGARELLALGLIGGILYGFRASGLASSRPPERGIR